MAWNEVEDIKGVWIEEVIVYADIVDVCVCVCVRESHDIVLWLQHGRYFEGEQWQKWGKYCEVQEIDVTLWVMRESLREVRCMAI